MRRYIVDLLMTSLAYFPLLWLLSKYTELTPHLTWGCIIFICVYRILDYIVTIEQNDDLN